MFNFSLKKNGLFPLIDKVKIIVYLQSKSIEYGYLLNWQLDVLGIILVSFHRLPSLSENMIILTLHPFPKGLLYILQS